RALYEDRGGRLWIGTNGGLDRFDPQTGGFVHYRHDPANRSSLGSGKVRAILEDRAGNLWIGLLEPGSLDRLDPSTGTFTRYEHDAANPTSLTEAYGLTAIHEDATGALWLGTYSGLERLDPATGRFQHYKHDPGNAASLSHDFTWSIYEDLRGVIWVGTDGGLDRYDPGTGQFAAYTVENGLPTDQVKAVLADEQGRLWLGIDGGGVSSFDPQTGRFRNFDLSDGLAGRDAVVGAYARGPGGRMYFGTLTGVTAFRPDDVKLNTSVPPIVLSAFRRFDRPVSFDRPLSRIDALALSYGDNFFAFEFAALDYTDPAKNRYAYQLVGFDQDWIQSGTRRYASYTNLAPGTYTFRVKAANNDGVWNEAGPAVRVLIAPPVWQTWWFRTLAAAIILGAVAAVIRTREAYVATLRASEERFRAIFDQAPLFVCELDTTASPPRILRANRAAGRVFGVPAAALHDLPLTTLMPPESWAAVDPVFKSLAPEKTLDCECAALRQNGSQFPARLSLTGGTGQQSGRSILVMEDITAEQERRSEEQAIAEERQRIARELHDGLAQDLAGIRFRIALWHRLVDSDPVRMHAELGDLQTLLAKDIRDVRRSIFALRPLVLDELGFLPALRRFIHEFAEQNQLAVDLQVGGLGEALPLSLEFVLFRIIQESLHNVSKHAMAAAACVTISRDSARTLKLTVSDNGQGFETARLDLAVASGHLGLQQMKERVQKLGGALNVRSRPGRGTEIEAILPLAGEGDGAVDRENP
ncbi:MAG TPA: triple tyrosine motif-containing protein, partial [Anaerolineae bacterium]